MPMLVVQVWRVSVRMLLGFMGMFVAVFAVHRFVM
jgi:hypothetical protein